MPTISGVRCIELEMNDVARADDFFRTVWNLDVVEQVDGSIYYRGTGHHHHILAVHPASRSTAVRRLVFETSDRHSVDTFHRRIGQQYEILSVPHDLGWPGGGYGFEFKDIEQRNYAIVCGCADHSDTSDVPDRPRKIAHVNINAVDVETSVAFLVDMLGFRVIDRAGPLVFVHCDNSDHNSMVVCTAPQSTINHIAFELPGFECVMRGGGRMRDAGYPIEWGVGRHGPGNNIFAYFAGPEEIPLEYTSDILQIDDGYEPHGPDYWRWPPGRLDQWGITAPHSARWRRIQNLLGFADRPKLF